jgi:hypothetical protein
MEREEQRKTVKSYFTDELKLVAHPVGIMTWVELFRCIFYSFIYSLTNRQGSLPIDTFRQKSRFSGATSPPSQVSSASKKPLRGIRLSPIVLPLKLDRKLDRNADNYKRTITNIDEHEVPLQATGGILRNTSEQGSSYPPFETHKILYRLNSERQ